MTLRDRIICSLWVERRSSVARLAYLTGADRETVYQTIYSLCSAGMVIHPEVGVYKLTEKGSIRAMVVMALDREGLLFEREEAA